MDGDEEQQHSVVNAKVAGLVEVSSGFIPGASITCKLSEGTFPAKIIAAGVYVCVWEGR